MDAVIVIALGFAAAFVSGLLGVGGAILLIPLLRFVPPAVGLPGFTMAEIAGISIVQVLVASALGLHAHHRAGAVSWELAAPMAVASGLGAALGGGASGAVPERVAELAFAALASLAAILMILPARDAEASEARPNLPAAIASAGGVGVVAGVLGAGGAFLLAPLMRNGLGVPIRKIIGISLVVVAAGALMGTIGKGIAGQIVWGPALLAALGALPAAPLGARLSHRLDAKKLRFLLALLIAAAAVRMVLSAV